MIYINRFFLNTYNKLRKFYLNSRFYDNKISKIDNNDLIYKPSPHLFSSLIKYQKKIRIEDFALEEILKDKTLNTKDYKNLNNFYWFFGLDLKSSKKNTQSVINNWILNNFKFNSKSWDFDLTAKRVIAWLSCYNLTFEESSKEYRDQFNLMIQKQTNHLINEINNSKKINDKMIGCAAIILVGLCYKEEKNLRVHCNM